MVQLGCHPEQSEGSRFLPTLWLPGTAKTWIPRRMERLFGMTNELHHSWRKYEAGNKNADPDETPVSLED